MRHSSKQLSSMSNAVKSAAISAIKNANSGHLGIVLGASDIITTIYANYLRRGTDRFVLSAGHGSAMLYSVLKFAGYNIGDLNSFRKIGGLPGHPEFGTDGVESSTGPLGQGVANAVGMALAQKIKSARGQGDASAKTYCLCSDGDLMEGVAAESMVFAGVYNLNNLIICWDDNGISIDGVALVEKDIPARVAAAGFEIITIDGNDFDAINYALRMALASARPVFIQCKTIIGLGSSVAGTHLAHALSIKDDEITNLENKFYSTDGIKLWDEFAKNNLEKSLKNLSENNAEINDFDVLEKYKSGEFSTRELSVIYLESIINKNNLMIGGSADLSGNTGVKTAMHRDIKSDDFTGNFINYGVREHGMAAVMNGLCLSGFRPYSGTFLTFSDYMRPAIRMSALMGAPVIYVFSHDSIMVGEDGPTHQPIEHISSLRLIPNMNVFRPANMAEVAAVWQMAMREKKRPSCIILSRQKFEQIPTINKSDIEFGGYIIKKSESRRVKITLIATGAEVPLAIEISKRIHGVQVVSMPSVEMFRAQSDTYKKTILRGRVIALEAGATAPWYEFADAVIGIDSFGESGAGLDVYKKFGFDADAIAREISRKIK